MKNYRDLTEDSTFRSAFRGVDIIHPQLLDRGASLAMGVDADDIETLLKDESLRLQTTRRANSTHPFAQRNKGLQLSFTYGAQSEDFSSVAIFDPSTLDVTQGHNPEYISSYPDPIYQQHKMAESNVVARANGKVTLDDIFYLIARKDDTYHKFAHGLPTNLFLRRMKRGESNNSNVVLGETHYRDRDIINQFQVLSQMDTPEIILSEVLGNNEITSQEDVAKLRRTRGFDMGYFNDFSYVIDGQEFNSSHTYLVDMFNKTNIPILGIGDFKKGIRSDLKDLLEKYKTLTIVGKSHTDEINELSDGQNTVYHLL